MLTNDKQVNWGDVFFQMFFLVIFSCVFMILADLSFSDEMRDLVVRVFSTLVIAFLIGYASYLAARVLCASKAEIAESGIRPTGLKFEGDDASVAHPMDESSVTTLLYLVWQGLRHNDFEASVFFNILHMRLDQCLPCEKRAVVENAIANIYLTFTERVEHLPDNQVDAFIGETVSRIMEVWNKCK